MSAVTHVELRSGAYADSVTLLGVSRDVGATDAVLAAQVAMATPLNLDVLAQMGFSVPPASPNDLVVALRVADQGDLPAALVAVDEAMAAASRRPSGEASLAPPRTTRSAQRLAPGLALVSVPGPSAVVEAVDALEAGQDVMVFSDNVPLEHEVALKGLAAGRGLLVMGPDCGTAVVGGVALGFANVVSSGPVGLVAASGTGCQQLLCLLHAAGVGVSAALGVGGRDLSAEVDGRSTFQALRRLDADPSISRILVISKPPAAEVADRLESFVAGLDTPVHLALLGPGRPDLTAAADAMLRAMGREVPDWPTWGRTGEAAGPGAGRPGAGRPEGLLRGLFVGGTLCDEAMLAAAPRLGPVLSNIPLAPDLALDASLTAPGHLMIDFGDDALTQGRAHPMIDPTLRLQHLHRVARDDRTGVVLLDVVLGHGAEPDPAARLAPAVADLVERRPDVRVVVACVGTDLDPQGLDRQAGALARAGAEVHLSNSRAAGRAVDLTLAGRRA